MSGQANIWLSMACAGGISVSPGGVPALADEVPSIAVEAVYTGDIWRNTSGGLQRATRYLDNVDLLVEANFPAFGNDATLFAYGLYNNGQTLSADVVGDVGTVSNIDAEQAFRLFELWYEQAFADGEASLKVGLYDLNSEFDALDTAGLFINSSHGIGADFSQSGANGPSIFPVTSLGVRAQ